MSDDKKFPPMMTKEAFESLYKNKEFSESLVTEDDGLTGSDSIREGIDAEILQMMMNKSLVEEEAAIIDDLKRQMEAGVIMPQVYVPLQVSNIFKKEE